MANWTREQLLLALDLYLSTPFGKQHKGYPPIIQLANKIGRTPSAVAMKLCNFTSLDPVEQARGITGLPQTSKLDREIWAEFCDNKEAIAIEIEYLHGQGNAHTVELPDDSDIVRETETSRTVTTRLHQNFFRRVVINSYEERCCITGNPIRQLLRASHIVPWADSTEHRLNPRNGLCLAATFDVAFDRGLIAFDDTYCLLLGPTIYEEEDNSEIRDIFFSREGKPLNLPEKNLPDLDLLKWHRENVAGF